jgi:hypothetical protein
VRSRNLVSGPSTAMPVDRLAAKQAQQVRWYLDSVETEVPARVSPRVALARPTKEMILSIRSSLDEHLNSQIVLSLVGSRVCRFDK